MKVQETETIMHKHYKQVSDYLLALFLEFLWDM